VGCTNSYCDFADGEPLLANSQPNDPATWHLGPLPTPAAPADREIQGPSVQLATAEDECPPWQEYAMPGYPTDHAGLEILPFDECLRLLASVPVGRVGFFADGDGRRRWEGHRIPDWCGSAWVPG
jgi:hypothetical protein